MKALIAAAALAVGMMAVTASPADAYPHHGGGWHHHRHCTGWGFHHHRRFCRGWGW